MEVLTKTQVNYEKKISFLKGILLVTVCFVTTVTNAQDYQITFTGSGESNTVETVLVKNLDQDTELTLLGTDILQLTATLGIDDIISSGKDFLVYPNPMLEIGNLVMYSKNNSTATIRVTDSNGKQLIQHQEQLQAGNNRFMYGFTKRYLLYQCAY